MAIWCKDAQRVCAVGKRVMGEAKLPNVLNLPFVEELYAEYASGRGGVPEPWRQYFQALENGERSNGEVRLRPSFRPSSIFNPRPVRSEAPVVGDQARSVRLQDRVDQLIRAYRSRGHMIARINPLGFSREFPPELDPEYYGFTVDDMEREFSCESIHRDGPLPLSQILDKLWNTYCRSIGVEYMHIDDQAIRRWLQERMEPNENRRSLTRDEQLRIFTRLTDAATFEEFIRKKFVGAKSFSLEGSESLIPLLDLAIEAAGEQGIVEIVLGMAHRGRLNVLANIMGKSPRRIFREFADTQWKAMKGGGDVKYHLGYSRDWGTASGKNIHLSLCFNPSHLEFVNPVVLGRIRAKQDRAGDAQRRKGMALLIHGDAAFMGEGVVQETLNLTALRGYAVGGTLHVVVNNQIGFTTSPNETRSTNYATDIAKMLQVPIFHVNGEDPEAVAQVIRLAMDFRRQFQRDVVVDMYGYRRLGHNESDEPSFTQPVLYQAIAKRKSVREGYLDHLLKLGGISREEANEIARQRQEQLEKELSESQKSALASDEFRGIWAGYVGGPEAAAPEVSTGVPRERLREFLEKQATLPPDFTPHPKIKKFLEARRQMARGEIPVDWSNAEALAFASLAAEGYRVRLSGQDSARGTFTQRHAVLTDYQTGQVYVPLQQCGPVEIINSPLSETGVLGFDYGYSLDYPDGLVMWEAQFGDFVNAAQVIVDQFIASAEEKWHRLSGIVLLLPHGFEGAGPEHSSARLERFLELSANDNIQVVNATTPAQYFHLLRRQVLRKWRKPLVIMTPKSLLRHPQVVSPLDEFTQGSFRAVLPGTNSQSRRILLCSGKIYYELEKQRSEGQRQDVAIVRVEQLYPLRLNELKEALSAYAPEVPAIWVQEEPENMGAWRFLRAQLGERLFGRPFSVISRPAAASPATGSTNRHKREQAEIIAQAFTIQ
jgi:2-oxoglutarate dehydrogenase E1 component